MEFSKVLKNIEQSPDRKAKVLVKVENPTIFDAWLKELFMDEQIGYIPGCLIYGLEAGNKDKVLDLHHSYFNFIKEAIKDMDLDLLDYTKWLETKPLYKEFKNDKKS
jgi:hypothetical protein